MKKRIESCVRGKLIFLLLLIIGCGSAVIAQQETTITGSVRDAQTGDALSGVTIEGGSATVVTSESGVFSVALRLPAKLVFSSVGYSSLTVDVTHAGRLDIVLSQTSQSLGEVVVVGYGTQKKTSLTAAVATMKGKDISNIPLTNLSNGIGGRLTGVIFKQGTGEPGVDGANIYIRGISSTGSNQPLLIVDGIPRSFQQLEPNSVESFSVLKDAAAVAPYGVAGANGVILVTTKRGRAGEPTVTYNGYVGFQNPTVLPDYVNGYEYATLRNAAAENEGLPVPYSEDALERFKDGTDPDRYPPTTDTYKRVLTSNAILTNHNVDVTGGTDRIKYYVGLGYQYQAGMWPAANNYKYSLTSNLDIQASKTTKVSLNIIGRNQKVTASSIGSSRLFELIGWVHPGIGPLVFSNGMSGSYLMGNLFKSGYFNRKTNAIYSQISIEQQLSFIPGLYAKGTVAYDPTIEMVKTWTLPNHMASIDVTQTPYVITDGIFGQVKPSLNQTFNQSRQLSYQASLNYNRTYGKNTISGLALIEAKADDRVSLNAIRMNYNLLIDEISMGSSTLADISNSGTSTTGRQVGLVYRLTYDYSGKYLLEASGRYDGSYYFAPGKRFGYFPAFSAGWRLSEEGFMKRMNWIDNLKIRGSYGEVGALAGSPFQFLSTYSVSGPAYVINGQAVQGVNVRAEANPNITWEKAKKTDVGLEATLFRGLLNIEVDYFYEKRSNMLVNPDVVVPLEYGIGLSQVNAGIMKNQGMEFSINTFRQFSNDLKLSVGGNFTYAKNTLLQIFESPVTYNNPNRRLTGRSLGTQFGFRSLGFFQQDDFELDGSLKKGIAIQPWGKVQPGDIQYDDLNHDGVIDDNDLTAIGDAVAAPRIVYGITSQITYKGFTLDILFQGAARSNFYQNNGAVWPFWNGMNAYKQNMNYWTPENPNAKNPRITTAPTPNNTQVSSFWLADASYMRLKNATLSYSIPSKVAEKIRAQNLRVYLSGQNILTWTKMINFDPEILPTPGGWSPNSGWNYPQQKVLSIGLNIVF